MNDQGKSSPRLSCSLIACLAFVSACTSPVSLEAEWQPGARPAAPFSNVLVVAVSEDFDRRRLFEIALADELAARGSKATPSSRNMHTADVLDRESVTALVKATGADAVLVTRLVNQEVGVRQKRGGTVPKMGSSDDEVRHIDPYGYNFYTYDFRVTREPSSMVVKRDARVNTDLFDTREGRLLYAIRSDVRITSSASLDQNTDVAVIDELAGAIARRLRTDGAVR